MLAYAQMSSKRLPKPRNAPSKNVIRLVFQAIEHHRKRVRFISTAELVNALEQEKAQGKAM